MILFLGSGISIPTGLPPVMDLMEGIMRGEWYRHTSQLFQPGKPPDWDTDDPTPTVQRFLQYVKGLADAVHAKRGIDPANYEDLFYLLKQLFNVEMGEERNAAVDSFINSLRTELQAFPLNKGHSGAYPTHLTALAAMGCDLIQSVVGHKLSTKKAAVGLDLVRDLVARGPVTIATLNHDLLVERLLAAAQIPYVDGFGLPDGHVRWFEEQRLSPSDGTRILKLHGSINWFQMIEDLDDGTARPRTVIPVVKDPWHCTTANGKLMDNWGGQPLFLTGVGNKASSYNTGIFAEMFFRFHEALKSNDTIIMSGYGWGDKGVNARLVDWLFEAPNHRLIMLHENPEEFISRPTPLTNRREWLIKHGRLVEVRKWMKDVTLADIDSLTEIHRTI